MTREECQHALIDLAYAVVNGRETLEMIRQAREALDQLVKDKNIG